MATTTDVEPTSDELAEAKKRIRALEREKEELAQRVTQYKPTANIEHLLFYDAETVEAYYSRQQLEDMVYEGLATENMERRKRGLDPVRFDKETMDRKVEEKVRYIVSAFTRPPTNRPARVIKMYDPKTDTIREVAMEAQINNMAGSLADGIVKYQRKGFKLTDPFMCARSCCRQMAALNADGKWAFEGYCSGAHRDQVEVGRRGNASPSVVTQDVMNRVNG